MESAAEVNVPLPDFKNRDSAGGTKASPGRRSLRNQNLLPFTLVFSHGFLFFVQSVVFTYYTAIFHDMFQELHIIERGEEDKTPIYVGYFSGSFFAGKLISDFVWGVVRDAIGDKKCINAASLSLIISITMLGFSWDIWSMLGFSFIVGLSSGLFVPGLAFCNWIEPDKRNALVMWIYIFSGAGSLMGPFIGSMLFSVFSSHRLAKTTIVIALMMTVSLLCFNYSFADFDDRELIERSKYSELIEDQNKKIKQISDMRASSGDLVLKESQEDKFQKLDSSITDDLRFIEGRKRLSDLGAWEATKVNSARPALILACGIVWGVLLIDFILFPVWTELGTDQGGLNFSTVQAGAISLLNFPIVSITLIYIYKRVLTFKASYVMHVTTLIILVLSVLVPCVAFFHISHDYKFFVLIIITSIKEVAHILFLSTWSSLFSKLVPSKNLGKTFSWSFLVGHIILAVLSQVFPRLMTVFINNHKIISLFKEYNMVAFFSLMISPLLIVIILVGNAKRVLYKEEQIFI